jgi:peptidoglycan hydrolase-like protein with peptidoglycan-binding domain
MDYRTLVNKLEAIQAGTYIKEAIANPYTDPAQAAIFNAMSDADQEWLTRGGGVPDITDKYILMRAPNKGQPDPAKAAAKQKTQADTTSDAFIKEKLAKLAELVAKLKAGSQGAKPATMPAQATSIEQAKALGAANPQVKESSIANELVESFGYQTTNEGPATTAALKATGKLGARVIPGAGLALGAYDAYNRAKQGDWTGAAIDAAGGVAGLIPGVGTAAQIGLMGVQAGRDKARTGSFFPDDNEIKTAAAGQAPAATQAAKPAAGVDPKVQALQQKLIAAGAKIKADGIMGPATQAAMKQFPQVKESVAESMASLRDRLAMIETEQQVDEDWRASALKGVGNLAKGVKFGFKDPTRAANLSKNLNTGMMTKLGRNVGIGAKTVAKNPKTAIAGAAALGTGLGYAATSKPTGTTPPVKPPSTSTQGGKPTPDGSTTTATADPELIKQIQAVMGEIADIETPEVIAALQNAQAAIEGKPVTAAAPATQAAKPATAPAPQSNFGTGK